MSILMEQRLLLWLSDYRHFAPNGASNWYTLLGSAACRRHAYPSSLN